MDDYAAYDGVGLAELVRKGDATPSELVDAAILRIERRNGALNAVVHRAYDEARALAASGALHEGPFRGVPFLVKDYGPTVAGWPNSHGSRFAKDLVDDADSGLVTRYRRAGLVLVGKTNVPEFAATATTEGTHLGTCRNPWNTDHTTGGSSGGSAAAVAAGMVPLAHGNDAGGSIRIPAACCGLVGLKPTRDRVPNLPDGYNYAYGQQCEHVLSRTVRDAAVMLDATGVPETGSPYAIPAKARPYAEELRRAPGRLRIAWPGEADPLADPEARAIAERTARLLKDLGIHVTEPFEGPAVHPEVQATLERTAKLLEALGHEVIPRSLVVDGPALYAAFMPMSGANFAAGVRRLIERVGREPEEDELEPSTWASLRAARNVTGEAAMWGLQELRALNRKTLQWFEDVDIYLSPVMTAPPPELGYLNPVGAEAGEAMRRGLMLYPYTQVFNFTGQPSISLPLGESKDGLPIGMLFTARYADEATLIRLAAQLEKEAPWKDRRPRVWD
jgi:amidase